MIRHSAQWQNGGMPSGLSEAHPGKPRPAHGGTGGRGPIDDGPDFGGGGDHGGGDYHFSPGVYQVGMIVALFSIAALFIALVLAYGIQLGKQTTWQRVRIPVTLWVSTGLLAASSIAFERGRRGLRRGLAARYTRLLIVTTSLGLAFIASQLAAWYDLKRQGVYVFANLHGSMFFVFTGAHGIHVLLGILSLFYLCFRSTRLNGATEQAFRKERAFASAFALYWHFMGALWIILFALLHLWS
jgi:cytochrome c oxidase subunit 3